MVEELGYGVAKAFDLVGHGEAKQEAGTIVVEPEGW
jgi:hypothetical protein